MKTISTRFLHDLPGHIYKGKTRKAVLSLNSRSHWAHKARVKKNDRVRVAGACMQHGLAGLHLTKAEVRVILHYRTRAPRDFDNAMAHIKGVLDELVDADVIADDSADVIGQTRIEFRAPSAVEGFEVELTYED